MNGPLRHTPRGLFLHVKATPKAARDDIAGLAHLPDGSFALSVKVTAVAEKSKANAAIITLIAKSAGVAKSSFMQVAGETDRIKIFRIDHNAEKIAAWIAEFSQA